MNLQFHVCRPFVCRMLLEFTYLNDPHPPIVKMVKLEKWSWLLKGVFKDNTGLKAERKPLPLFLFVIKGNGLSRPQKSTRS